MEAQEGKVQLCFYSIIASTNFIAMVWLTQSTYFGMNGCDQCADLTPKEKR